MYTNTHTQTQTHTHINIYNKVYSIYVCIQKSEFTKKTKHTHTQYNQRKALKFGNSAEAIFPLFYRCYECAPSVLYRIHLNIFSIENIHMYDQRKSVMDHQRLVDLDIVYNSYVLLRELINRVDLMLICVCFVCTLCFFVFEKNII